MSTRARFGKRLEKIFPGLEEQAFRRQRRSSRRAMARVNPQGRKIRSGFQREHAHVVVVPQEGRDFTSWAPGTRNLYWEAAKVLEEQRGSAAVSVFHVERGEPPARWHTSLSDYLMDVRATHVLMHAECDPGSEGKYWTWDAWWEQTSRWWQGTLLGVLFDSAWPQVRYQSRILSRISHRYLAIDICVPGSPAMSRGRAGVGPVNMPISRTSSALLGERLADVSVAFDLSFIGALYPYRQRMLEQLQAAGLSITINPHRSDITRSFEESRTNQPGWLDYMAGLASSRATLNFSESSARGSQQFKTRVLEAGLAGTLLLTDDRNLTSRFWIVGDEFREFTDAGDLLALVDLIQSDASQVDAMRTAFAKRAQLLAHTHFWGALDVGLASSGLPKIGAAAIEGIRSSSK